jgi:CheY-like chemotaxis protein
VFDAFFQTDSRQSAHQGTGLGLPISQRFVSMMGGNLELHSTVGGETKFRFAIPVEIVDGADVALSQQTRRVIALEDGQADFRLLVVEDNENNRNLLTTLLRTVGFDVQEAVNGRDAIEVWEKWQPHLIWMDIRMPIMDGYEATTHIRTSSGGEDPVIIALTASAFEEDRAKVLEHGGNDFVRKPFREAEIFGMMEKYLGVKFVYGEEDEILLPQAGNGISLEDLKSMVATLQIGIRARLAEATELSDAAMIDQVIKDIRVQNVALADALADMANNFAYDEILALVQDSSE